MKILSGNEQRDSGTIYINRQEIDISHAKRCAQIWHRHHPSKAEYGSRYGCGGKSISAGEQTSFAGILDRKRMRSREAGRSWTGLTRTIDPRAPLGSLSIGRQQMVEIARRR